MNESSSGGSAQNLAQRIPNSVGVPIQVLVFAGVAVLAVLVGTVSVGAAFALFVLGLLALVILDHMLAQQGASGGQAPPAGDTSSASSGEGYFSNHRPSSGPRENPEADFQQPS